MSTVDLMLLGALLEKPMNAYEMKKTMEFRNIRSWVKLSTPSIYKNLLSLKKKGYLDSKTVKESEMPEKTIYSINDKGKLYFRKLMEKYSDDPGMIYIDFAAFTANLHHIDYEDGSEMIKTLQSRLAVKQEMIKENIDEKKDSVPQHAFLILDLYSRMYSLFNDWLEEFSKDYIDNNKS